MEKEIIYIKDLKQTEYLTFYSWYSGCFDDWFNTYLIVNSESKIIQEFCCDIQSNGREYVFPDNRENFHFLTSLNYGGIFYTDKPEYGYLVKQPQTPLHKAITIVSDAFSLKTDKAGKPYIYHLLYVMGKGQNIKEKIAGVLHDLIEDCSDKSDNEICIKHYSANTYAELISQEFGQEIFEAVKCITKIKGEEYDEYLKRVKENELARKVKLYDLEHNMDVSRLLNPRQEDYYRLEKYRKSYNYLKF
jgi:hypothetical protein